MKGLSISTLMTVIALIAVDAWLVRAFVVGGNCAGLVFIVPTLQVAVWRSRHTRGRQRWFWSGFVLGGVLGVLAMLVAEMFPRSVPDRCARWFVEEAFRVRSDRLPTPAQDFFDDHEDFFFAVVYFLPTLTTAVVGGLIGAASWRRPAAGVVPEPRDPTAT